MTVSRLVASIGAQFERRVSAAFVIAPTRLPPSSPADELRDPDAGPGPHEHAFEEEPHSSRCFLR